LSLSAEGDSLKIRADHPPPADLLARLKERKAELLAELAARYRDTLARSAGVPFDWLVAHYFWPADLADIDAGRYPDPVALGELIRADPDYPFGWRETEPVAASAGVRND
jgi:hypothetical protein